MRVQNFAPSRAMADITLRTLVWNLFGNPDIACPEVEEREQGILLMPHPIPPFIYSPPIKK
jgi:hypothetical protein